MLDRAIIQINSVGLDGRYNQLSYHRIPTAWIVPCEMGTRMTTMGVDLIFSMFSKR